MISAMPSRPTIAGTLAYTSMLTVFAVQQNRNRKNAVLVVEDGANDLCGRSADAELGTLLAAQDGPAAFTACVSKKASRSSLPKVSGYSSRHWESGCPRW